MNRKEIRDKQEVNKKNIELLEKSIRELDFLILSTKISALRDILTTVNININIVKFNLKNQNI